LEVKSNIKTPLEKGKCTEDKKVLFFPLETILPAIHPKKVILFFLIVYIKPDINP
jgi:hypothetical protein